MNTYKLSMLALQIFTSVVALLFFVHSTLIFKEYDAYLLFFSFLMIACAFMPLKKVVKTHKTNKDIDRSKSKKYALTFAITGFSLIFLGYTRLLVDFNSNILYFIIMIIAVIIFCISIWGTYKYVELKQDIIYSELMNDVSSCDVSQ